MFGLCLGALFQAPVFRSPGFRTKTSTKLQVISSLGDYLTANGGRVNLKQVDVIMSEVGEIEDEVFKRRKQADIKDQVKRLSGCLRPPPPPPSFLVQVASGLCRCHGRCRWVAVRCWRQYWWRRAHS